jgi:hypothetical protein
MWQRENFSKSADLFFKFKIYPLIGIDMIQINSPLDLASLSYVTTMDAAAHYYRSLQKEHFRGVPGVGVAAEAFGKLRPLFDAFHASSPQEAGHLWLLPHNDGGVKVATHLHRSLPGRSLSLFLETQSLCPLTTRFAARWERLEKYYLSLRGLYVLFVVEDCEANKPEQNRP